MLANNEINTVTEERDTDLYNDVLHPEIIAKTAGAMPEENKIYDLSDFFRGGHSVYELHLDIHQYDVKLCLISGRNLVSVVENRDGKLLAVFFFISVQIFTQLVDIVLFIFYDRDSNHLLHPKIKFKGTAQQGVMILQEKVRNADKCYSL